MYNLLLVDDEPLIKVAFQSAVEWGKNGFLLAATASNCLLYTSDAADEL